MTTLACTKSLLKRLKAETVDAADVAEGSNKLRTWSAKEFVFKRKRYVMAINGESMLVVVVRLSPGKSLRTRLADSLEELFIQYKYRVDADWSRREVEALREAVFTTNSDRRLMGSLNRLVMDTEYILFGSEFGGTDEECYQLQARLSDTPHHSFEHTWPEDALTVLYSED